MTLKRIVSVWLKDWPITAWSWANKTTTNCGVRAGVRVEIAAPCAASNPFALVERGPRGLVLAALNPAAQALGLRLGQAHADACALAPSLKSEPVKPGQAEDALRRLALWAQRYGPLVALDQGFSGQGSYLGWEGLWIETTGVDHLFGGEQALLADLTARLARAGAEAQVGLAGTPGAAWALARFAAPHEAIAPPGGEGDALTSLPVEALRLSPGALQLLGRFGLRRIGDLYALPRAGLARRFRGEAGGRVMLRLDQALGRVPEPLTGETPPETYIAHRVFAEPILHAEGVAQWGARLAVELCAKLEEEGLGARRIVLTGFRTDGRTTWVSAALGLASRDPEHLIRLLRERGWARLELGFGLDALRLSAPVTEPLTPSQRSLSPSGESEKGGDTQALEPEQQRAMAVLIDRLTARLGEAAVLRPVWRESWTPERAEQLAPYEAAPPTHAAPKPVAQPRPFLMFSPPEPIEAVAELPDGAPAQFTWRRVSRRVWRASGPERLAPDWWRGPRSARGRPAAVRDYYRLEDEDGGRYWVFREGLYGAQGADGPDRAPSWWMHGLFA
jgi:protein ImuB